MFDTGAVSQNSMQHFRMFAVGLVLQENLSLRCSCYEGFIYDLSSSACCFKYLAFNLMD